MWVITVLTHGFLNSILHDISGGIERIMEGINGPLSAASRVVFDIVNLVIDAIVFIYDAITVTQGVRNLAKQAGSWEKLFAKFRRLLVRNFNKKFFAALIGDIANALWSVPTIIGDYDNLRHDAREAGYSWVLS